jgi:hypothetical protein
MNDKSIIGGVVVLLLAVGAILYATSSDVTMKGGDMSSGGGDTSGVVDTGSPTAVLAQCLKDKGAVFYGAFWCEHCAEQKKRFGSAEKLLPYVECSTPDQRAQTQICIAKKIQSYPTWEFLDGSRLTGVQTLTQLAEKTGCVDPASAVVPTENTPAVPTAPVVNPS